MLRSRKHTLIGAISSGTWGLGADAWNSKARDTLGVFYRSVILPSPQNVPLGWGLTVYILIYVYICMYIYIYTDIYVL